MAAVLCLPVVFAVMGPCLKNGFSNWDDPTYLENNPLIREMSLANVKKIFTEIYFSNYQPLHILSYMLEYSVFKLDPYGYHLVSLLMHAAVTVIVVWFTFVFSEKKLIAIITGLLFAIHPMHVESIAWAAERKDLLYAFFFFASLTAYLYYIRNTEKKINLWWSFLLFALAIFSKAMAAALPPVLVLTDMYFRRKLNGKVILEKVPFFLLAFIMGAVSVYASSRDGSIDTNKTYNFFDRIILAHANLVQYYVKLVAPLNLSGFYPYPDKTGSALPWFYYLAPLVVLIMVVLVIRSLKQTRIIFYCTGFFLLTVFLVLQLLPVGPTIFSERYSYIPSAAFFMLAAYGMDFIIEKNKQKSIVAYSLYAVVAIYSIWLSVIAHDRCLVWKNPDTFWTDVIAKAENVPIAYNNRGHYYNKNGKKEEAMADFNKALSLNADYDMALFNRGSQYGERGQFKESLADLDKAIRINGKLSEAYKMRGQVYAMTGRSQEALADFNKALALNPEFAEVYFNLGIFYYNAGNKAEACKNFSKANAMHFENAKAMVDKTCN